MRRSTWIAGIFVYFMLATLSGSAASAQIPADWSGASVIAITWQDYSSGIIASVFPKGPADQAGLKPGDKILSVDGTGRQEAIIVEYLQNRPVGSQLTVTYLRDGTQTSVKVTTVDALNLYEKSANEGDAQGEASLGRLYYDGEGVPGDNEKAAYWYQKAADAGNAEGEDGLAYLYETGRGVPNDREKAIFWYQKAAVQGNDNARRILSYLRVNVGVTSSSGGYSANSSESPEEVASDRQSKIQELQGEIESAQTQLQDYDQRAAQMRQQAAQAASQPGGYGAIAAGIGYAGAAKFQDDAQRERQKIADLTSQIRTLRQESAAADKLQASLRTSSNSSTDAVASALSQSTSSGGSGTYTSLDADWVHRLLDRVGTWSCPSSPIAQDGAPPQVQTGEMSMRDQYVKSAVLEAWAAECYARQQRNNEAQAQAIAMMNTLRAVQSLCTNGGQFSNGPTDNIYRCGELPGGGGGTAVGGGPVPSVTRGPAPAGAPIQPSKCPDSRPCAHSAQ